MKVLHVIGPMRTGGAQTQLLGLVQAAHGRYWDATVVATSPGPMSDHFRRAGVPLCELRRLGSPGLLRIRALRHLVNTLDPDVVNGHLWQANVYARLAVAGRARRPQVVIEEHNVESGRPRARRRLDQVLARWTDAWVAPTDAMAEFLSTTHPVAEERITRIPYGLDKDIFRPGERPATSEIRIGTVARLDPEKSLDVLIDAGRLLAERMPVRILIAGEGPLRSDLERRAVGVPVSFLGSIEAGEPVADFLRTLDVFVLPSRHREARPVSVLEALCCGVPVVATDIPGMRETVCGGATLVVPGSAMALADAIASTASDPVAGTRALDAAENIPSFDGVARDWAAIFEEVLRGHARESPRS